MREAELLEAIGTFYDAASGAAPWDTAGEALRRSFGANTASQHLRGPDGVDVLFALGGLAESAASAAHYHRLTPWVRGFASVGGAVPGRPVARLGYEVLPEAGYRRGEFYQDFARHFGLFHVVGTVLSLDERGAVALAVLVAPLPARFARRLAGTVAAREDGVVPGRALVLARDFATAPAPVPDLFMDLFGLTVVEAEVAAALAGGATAVERPSAKRHRGSDHAGPCRAGRGDGDGRRRPRPCRL